MRYAAVLPILLTVPHFATAQTAFDRSVAPFFAKNCNVCHNEKIASGNLNLAQFKTAASVAADRERWELVVKRIKAGEMPPQPMPRPNADEQRAAVAWIEGELDRLDRITPRPGCSPR